MYLNILKKDLKRKKSMNIILFVFILLCTMFLSGSANNLVTTTNALDYFMEVANTSDYLLVTMNDDRAAGWVASNELVTSHEKAQALCPNTDSMTIQGEKYVHSGTSVLVRAPETYSLILTDDDSILPALREGEIAIPYLAAQNNGLAVGDTVTVSQNAFEREFTVRYITKDMGFGTSYLGLTRLVISDADYNYFAADEGMLTIDFFFINADDTTSLEKGINKQSFTLVANFGGSVMKQCYTMDMMVAAILIIVSVCLIVMAFVILRFTISFTLQEDYRQIGIMKAIGLKNRDIKGLYIVKYFGLSVVGAAIGVTLSVPFGNMMTRDIKNNLVMESGGQNILINILFGVIVILLVIAFCYISASKLNKFTAMQAIRSGSSGERFRRRGFYRLHRHGKTPLALQMAVSDIFANLKSYMVLVITFIIGTLLIILPLNAVNTLKSDSLVTTFGLAESDVYIRNHGEDDYFQNRDIDFILSDLDALEETYATGGVDVSLHVELAIVTSVYKDDPDDSHIISGLCSPDFSAEDYTFYLDGTAPVLPNEIAMTELTMEKLGVTIGDSVNVTVGTETQSYIITASFESMMNMGISIRFSSDTTLDMTYFSGVMSTQGQFADRSDIAGQISRMKEITPDYSIETATEYVAMYVGDITETLDSIKLLIVILVMVINCLLTVLMTRTFITKESGEIALLKNIGFDNRFLRIWHILRILAVLVVSVLLGILISHLLNPVVVSLTFGMMGASNVKETINVKEVYVLYPAILLAGTVISAVFSTLSIKKINFSDLGEVE